MRRGGVCKKSCGYARAVSQDLGHQGKNRKWPAVQHGRFWSMLAGGERQWAGTAEKRHTKHARGHHVLDIRHKKEHIKHDRLQDGESITKKIEGFVWNLGARHRDIAEAMKMYQQGKLSEVPQVTTWSLLVLVHVFREAMQVMTSKSMMERSFM